MSATKLAFGLLLAAATGQHLKYGNNHVPVRRDPPQVEASFPPPLEVNLLAPAFLSNESVPAGFANGTSGPTSQATMESYLRSLSKRKDWININTAQYLSEEGRPFPYVYLSTPTTTVTKSRYSEKVRIWLQGAAHGNEPAGDQSLLNLLGKMDANQTWTASVLDKADIMILPRYNPDGVAYFQRTLATNFDPNRDHIKLARQQSRDIKKTFSDFAPHVVADMHEYGASTRYGGLYLPGSDALFAAAKNLNIDSGIREMSEQLFTPAIGSFLETEGLRWEPYVTGSSSMVPNSTITYYEAGSDGKIGRNAMGLSQAITFLFEMRGIGIADQAFARRTYTGLCMLESTVQTAVDNAERVIRTVEDGITSFINSNEPVVVTDYSKSSTRNFAMVEYESGDIAQVEVEFFSTTPVIARTVTRPEAYIIPRAWADLVTRLEASGLEVETMPDIYHGQVEAYNITSASFDSRYYEGAILATVTTEPINVTVELPAGSFRMSTRQKNAALAMIALEPENIDSYVSFNIVPMEVGDEYPVYREMF